MVYLNKCCMMLYAFIDMYEHPQEILDAVYCEAQQKYLDASGCFDWPRSLKKMDVLIDVILIIS